MSTKARLTVIVVTFSPIFHLLYCLQVFLMTFIWIWLNIISMKTKPFYFLSIFSYASLQALNDAFNVEAARPFHSFSPKTPLRLLTLKESFARTNKKVLEKGD